jgi:hypothetical protein
MPKTLTREETNLYIGKVKLNINGLIHAGRYKEAFLTLIESGKVLDWKDYRVVLEYLEQHPNIKNKL